MNKSMKNQIVVYSIVLMLVVAGYLNYIENDNSVEISANTQNTTNIGDATLVNNNEIEEVNLDSGFITRYLDEKLEEYKGNGKIIVKSDTFFQNRK